MMGKWAASLKTAILEKPQVAPLTKLPKGGAEGLLSVLAVPAPGAFGKTQGEARGLLSVLSVPTPGAFEKSTPAAPSPTPTATSCATCAHRTPARTCGEPVAAGLAPRFRVVFLAAIGDYGTSCPAWRVDPPDKAAPASSASGPRLTAEQRDRLTGWTGEEIEQAGRYVALLTRRGLDVETVERVTDRLILRDREQDDRRLCLECARLDSSGRCGAAARGALRNADRRLEPLPLILQRCEGFEPAR